MLKEINKIKLQKWTSALLSSDINYNNDLEQDMTCGREGRGGRGLAVGRMQQLVLLVGVADGRISAPHPTLCNQSLG